MEVEYSWSPGRGYTLAAEVVGSVVQQIEEKEGACRPQALVDAARSTRSPIHSLFEWNDDKAAESFRTAQARNIIGSLKINVVKSDIIHQKPAFVSVKQSNEPKSRGYSSVMVAMSRKESREQLLAEALRQLHSLRQRYDDLFELAAVWNAIDDAQGMGII